MAREINLFGVAETNRRFVRGTNRVYKVTALTPYKGGVDEKNLDTLNEADATTTRISVVVKDMPDIAYNSYCPFNAPDKRSKEQEKVPTIGQFWVKKLGSLRPSEWKVGTEFSAKAIRVEGKNIHFDTRS